MSELADRIARSRDAVRPPWDDARAGRVHAAMLHRRRRRAQVRVGVAAVAGVALLVGAAWLSRPPPTPAPAVAVHDARVTPIGANSRARRVSVSAEREVVEVSAGRVRFEVPHRAGRVFRVEAGAVSVQVLGTTFTVDRTPSGASVAVSEGRVRVFWYDRYADLGAGESGDFPRAESLTQPAPAPTAESPARPPSAPSVESLLEEADAARIARNPERAVVLYRRALAARPDATTAMQLARVLRDDLRRPGEAADAFARARQIAPRGALADDALLHEVECRVAHGDVARARSVADDYLSHHPDGTTADRVRAALPTP